MKHIVHYSILTLALFALSFATSSYAKMRNSSTRHEDTTWTIIGAGPAGIATIGILLDMGVPKESITWIDPDFNIGRLGAYYYNVPGNALAENYISFVNDCNTFKQCSSESLNYLRNYYPHECCYLQVAIDALRDITTYLTEQVNAYANKVKALQFVDNNWLIILDNNISFSSRNVVLATGSYPKTLDYPCDYIIPLDDAVDTERLSHHIQPDDTIALVGASHSGMLILKHLYESGIKRVINFYLQPITYAYDMGNGNIPDYNGLKGDVAEWVFNILEKEQPETIMRVKNTNIARDAWLPICNKIIYAIGFERNALPLIDINAHDLAYNDTTGVIAPRLFGIGIAFPEKIIDPWGKPQHTVGMIDFLTYAQRIVPDWLHKKKTYNYLYNYKDLFNITLIPATNNSSLYH